MRPGSPSRMINWSAKCLYRATSLSQRNKRQKFSKRCRIAASCCRALAAEIPHLVLVMDFSQTLLGTERTSILVAQLSPLLLSSALVVERSISIPSECWVSSMSLDSSHDEQFKHSPRRHQKGAVAGDSRPFQCSAGVHHDH